MGGGAYTWGVGGGGAYKQQFPVPGLKTTSDVTHKKQRIQNNRAKEKLHKFSHQVFTPRMTPLFSITYLWLFRSFFQFFF